MAFIVTPKHKDVKLALHVSISFTKNGSSSQIQQQRPSTANSFSIESVESSIRSLLRSWYRRQKWQVLFNSTPPQELDRAPWRTHLASFLESTPVHAVSLGLLIIDLIFTILELSSSLLATSCRPNENHKATEEIWYHWVGVAILTLLSAKTIGLAVGLGTTFFRRPGYVIDGIVLMGALGLEVFLDKIGGGLLVVVSLWRVVRVVESAFELSDEAIEAQIEGLVCQFEMLREENRRLLETIGEKDQIIQKLQEDSDQWDKWCQLSSINIAVSLLWPRHKLIVMAFGGGLRSCVGAEFGRVQMAVFVHCLVTKYRWEVIGGKIVQNPGKQFPGGFHFRIQQKDTRNSKQHITPDT